MTKTQDTSLWDETGEKYQRGKGLFLYVDGKPVARSQKLEKSCGRPGEPLAR